MLSHSEESTLCLFVCSVCVCFASRWVLPDQCVCQHVSDPELGQGGAVRRLPDAGGPGGAEGVALQTEPRGPETEGEPAEPGEAADVVIVVVQHRNTGSVTACVWVWTVIHF